MAKVSGFSLATIRKYKGLIDFYYWKGIPCARKWPDWSHPKLSAGQKASMAAFSQAMTDLKQVSPHVRETWKSLLFGKAPSWIDEYKSRYMGFWKIYKTYPAVMVDFEDLGDI